MNFYTFHKTAKKDRTLTQCMNFIRAPISANISSVDGIRKHRLENYIPDHLVKIIRIQAKLEGLL